MNQLVTAMQKQANQTETLNGAKAYKSTKNAVLDLFSSWGGMRGQDILPLLRNAINEDYFLTLRCLLWGRDIRGGAGERDLSRRQPGPDLPQGGRRLAGRSLRSRRQGRDRRAAVHLGS